MIQNNVDFSHKNNTFHRSILKQQLALTGMCVLSVCQNSVEINKNSTCDIQVYISTCKGALAHEMMSNTSNGLRQKFHHVN